MASSEEVERKGTFECQLCKLTAPYSYFGKKPPLTHSIILLEECYVIKDPFTPYKDKFLILGSKCSVCSQIVCVGSDCSLFYTKRFCLQCVNENRKQFPREIQQELDKRKIPGKLESSKGSHSRS